MKKVVRTKNAPNPVGPYNQAIISGNFVFTAGQIALLPESGQLVENDIRKQTERVIKNIEAVLVAAGSDLESKAGALYTSGKSRISHMACSTVAMRL